MITVYHLENSRSQRILWMLEELGVPHDIRRSERDKKTMLGPADHKNAHPLGKWPLIVDGDTTLAESGAIVEYLAARYGGGVLHVGADDAAYPTYLHWIHFPEGSLQPLLLMRLIFSRLADQAPFLVKPVLQKAAASVDGAFTNPRITDQLMLTNEHLAGRSFFAAERLTCADIMMVFPLEAISARSPALLKDCPNIRRWIQQMHDRPAYQRALTRGGSYAYATTTGK